MVRVYLKSIITMAIAIWITSCGSTRHSFYDDGDRKPSRKRELIYRLGQLGQVYTSIYAKCPENVDDLLTFTERLNEETQMIYSMPYNYFKKHRDQLSFKIIEDSVVQDSIVIIYKGKRILAKFQYESPCDYSKKDRIYFFDMQGYFFGSDSLTRVLQSTLQNVCLKYKEDLRNHESELPQYRQSILEYIPGRLKNLCTNEIIDIKNSKFYTELYQTLDYFTTTNDMSRIILKYYIE